MVAPRPLCSRSEQLLGVPTLAFIAAAFYVVFTFVVTRTRFGAHVYAAGDSETAAYRTGVKVRRVFHKLRSLAVENFNEQFKGIFDVHGSVPPSCALSRPV